MLFGILLAAGFILFVCLVFFKFNWLKFSVAWTLVSMFIFVHVLFIFVIGLRFMTPCSTNGRIVNLQVQPGMVAGDWRITSIASSICSEGRYLLVNYNQENLKYVTNGQPVEVALVLYPGQIFKAKVEAIWKASGVGQMLPSGTLPDYEPAPPEKPQAQYAVKIVFDDEDQSKFTIGTQGAAAIYTVGMLA